MSLSPNYREDGLDGLDPKITSFLDEYYLPTLENLQRTNPRLLVVFSGGNGVGKSTLARKITDRFGAVLIENDAIKRVLLRLNPAYTGAEMSPLTWKYSMALYERLPELTQNGLVVRDGTIAWYFERILPQFEARGYELFVIDYQLSETKMIELVKRRGDTPTTTTERMLVILGEHNQHGERFRAQYAPDITLRDDTLFSHDVVIERLAAKIEALKQT